MTGSKYIEILKRLPRITWKIRNFSNITVKFLKLPSKRSMGKKESKVIYILFSLLIKSNKRFLEKQTTEINKIGLRTRKIKIHSYGINSRLSWSNQKISIRSIKNTLWHQILRIIWSIVCPKSFRLIALWNERC